MATLGVTLHLKTTIKQVTDKRDEGVDLEIEKDGVSSHFFASKVMVAIGRIPNTEAVQLDLAGVEVDEHNFIKVNEFMQTTNQHVYAIGDVAGNQAYPGAHQGQRHRRRGGDHRGGKCLPAQRTQPGRTS